MRTRNTLANFTMLRSISLPKRIRRHLSTKLTFFNVHSFQTTSQSVDEDVDRKVVVEQVIEFEPGLDSFSDRLLDVKGAQARVFLMYARYGVF